jgi:hypothetical protein
MVTGDRACHLPAVKYLRVARQSISRKTDFFPTIKTVTLNPTFAGGIVSNRRLVFIRVGRPR